MLPATRASKKDNCQLLGNIIFRTLPPTDKKTIPRTIQYGFTPVLRPGGLATDNPTHNSFDNAVILLGSECVHQHFHSREKQREEQFTPSNICRRLVLRIHWPINRNLYCHRTGRRSKSLLPKSKHYSIRFCQMVRSWSDIQCDSFCIHTCGGLEVCIHH